MVVLVDREQGGASELAWQGIALHAALTLSQILDCLVGTAGSTTPCARKSMRPSQPIDLSCRVAGVRFATPLVLRLGIWGTSPTLLERAARLGAGRSPRKPAPSPRGAATAIPRPVDWGHGLINAMGLPTPARRKKSICCATR